MQMTSKKQYTYAIAERINAFWAYNHEGTLA